MASNPGGIEVVTESEKDDEGEDSYESPSSYGEESDQDSNYSS